jgi:hypothetical protein
MDDKVENLQRYAEAQFKLYEALLNGRGSRIHKI